MVYESVSTNEDILCPIERERERVKQERKRKLHGYITTKKGIISIVGKVFFSPTRQEMNT